VPSTWSKRCSRNSVGPKLDFQFPIFVETSLGIDEALLLFNAIQDSLSLHLDSWGWCTEVVVNLMIPSQAQDAFLAIHCESNSGSIDS
jgi:hypothetical protein